jgi:hypothetical protein
MHGANGGFVAIVCSDVLPPPTHTHAHKHIPPGTELAGLLALAADSEAQDGQGCRAAALLEHRRVLAPDNPQVCVACCGVCGSMPWWPY